MKNFIIDRKKALLCGAIIIMLLVSAGITIAYLIDKTGDVDNKFTPTEVTCKVIEEFDGNEKTDVSIKNTGDIPAYIRATFVVNWVDKNDSNNVYYQAPVKDRDYTVVAGDVKWVEGNDGYYYWTDSVPVDGSTGELIKSIKLKEGAVVPDNYVLSVEIIADAVQADGVNGAGKKAVVDAWGVDPEELQ